MNDKLKQTHNNYLLKLTCSKPNKTASYSHVHRFKVNDRNDLEIDSYKVSKATIIFKNDQLYVGDSLFLDIDFDTMIHATHSNKNKIY